jgi:hypothetical protein
MLLMNPIEHALRMLDQFRGWKFPDSPPIPTRPWWPDADSFFQPSQDRYKRLPQSEEIIDHLITEGGYFHIRTGDTRPELQNGKVGGVFLNMAGPTDPIYTISREPGPGKLWVKTGYSAPYGAKVRIGKNFIREGYPMSEYSDRKMHIFDPIDRTITEIQYVEEVERNPLLNGFALLLSLLSGKNLHGGYHCHGVTQNTLTVPSTRTTGSSASRISLVGATLRYPDLMAGYRGLSVMATPQAAKKLSPGLPGYVWPATDSDGVSLHPHAMKMGQVLRLTANSYTHLLEIHKDSPLCVALLECWHFYGIILVDTGGTTSWGLEPDNRIPQREVKALANGIGLDDFEVWEIEP